MNKIFVIIGLVFLIAGSAMFGWIRIEKKKEKQRVSHYESKYDSGTDDIIEKFGLEGYDKSEIENQLRQDQEGRLQADLDELASGEIEVSPFADILYGEKWQDELNKYMEQKELSEVILTGSIVCISMGGTIFAWYLLLWLLRAIAKFMSGLKKYLTNTFKRQPNASIEEPEEIYVEKDMIEQVQEHSPIEKKTNDSRKLDNGNPTHDNYGSPLSTKRKNIPDKKDQGRTKKPVGISSDENVEEIAVLLSDEETTDSLAKLESSLKAQTELLEERTAQSVQEALKEHSKPLDSTLKDLAQQVSAIREYASCQQERVEKLQDGYDWNIIKTFCLRIIRCIDNLENRIERLSNKGTKTEYLEDIRDEMVFALESSGIEQYQPEINSDYRGQEKYAEAVKQKEHCSNSKQKGKIAKVIRPGYQYIINEENIKIVRTAQVKLFG
jgi:molecular chaperone GrpE (heat shock protein)